MARDKKSSRKKSGPKKSYTMIYVAVGVAVLSLILWAGFQTPKGTIKFGICRVFLEQTVTYPLELRVSSAFERPADVRLEYTTINEYGEYILSTVVCGFRPDPNTTWALTEVQINRQKRPQAEIDQFNRSIPFIISNPPDLSLPAPFPDDLMALQR